MSTFPALPPFWSRTYGSLQSACRSPRFTYLHTDMDSKALYGSAGLNASANRMIIEATISFIKKTMRFE